ncbi:MAG: CehA/McbA family metallohydrolase [Pirellulaceae bacterium]|nr:CehA/McbA family metallohydrolase [Pirellulaceae bacterium]
MSAQSRFLKRWPLAFILLMVFFEAGNGDEFEVRVVDAETKNPVSVRMTIRNIRGAAIKQRGVPFYNGEFCFFGKHVFRLPKGPYTYTIERGPEYRTLTGVFEVKKDATDGVTVSIPRFTDLKEKGWWSGDLCVYRPEKNIPVLMDASDLNFVNRIALEIPDHDGPEQPTLKKATENRVFHTLSGLDQRSGGQVFYIGLDQPIDLPKSSSLIPPGLIKNHSEAELVFVGNAAAWDLPVILAQKSAKTNGLVLGIAGDLLQQHSSPVRATGIRKPPNSFTGPHALQRWQTYVYYQALNCGFQIPPGAGSGSGRAKNPVGYNRMYVHCGPNFSYNSWISNLNFGRVVVTNGPVMEVRFNGLLPGETVQVAKGQSLEIETTMTLSLKEKADYLELIRNGMVAAKISLDEYTKAKGKLPKLVFQESGWMLARVVTNHSKSFRFATSGPIYIHVGDQPIRKKESAKFFFDWLVERAKAIQNSSSPEKEKAIEEMRSAYDFWKQLSAE